MPVNKSRGVTKKLGPLGLGSSIVKFRVSRKVFAVHENLICATSDFSKRLLQKNRKPAEGECPICKEDLNPSTTEITFCIGSCGNNFHEHCYKEWAKQKKTCPMCRATWTNQVSRKHYIKNVDAGAMDSYVKWVYDGQDQLAGKLKCLSVKKHENYFMTAMHLHSVGQVMDDKAFISITAGSIRQGWEKIETEVLQGSSSFIFGDTERSFVSLIWSIYNDHTIHQLSRQHFIRGLVSLIHSDCLESDHLPPAFYMDFARASAIAKRSKVQHMYRRPSADAENPQANVALVPQQASESSLPLDTASTAAPKVSEKEEQGISISSPHGDLSSFLAKFTLSCTHDTSSVSCFPCYLARQRQGTYGSSGG